MSASTLHLPRSGAGCVIPLLRNVRSRFASLGIAAMTFVGSLSAAEPPVLPSYVPEGAVGGVIHIWGDDQMLALVRRWESGFQREQPAVSFENRLLGSGTAMAGLYAGGADLAFMGRDATPKEIQAFQWVFRYPPERLDVATSGLGPPGTSPALVVLVPRDNPLAQITVSQLAAVAGCPPPDGQKPIRTWGELGLGGAWTDRPVHLCTFDTTTGTGLFLQHVLLHDSRKWAWDRVTEFRDRVDAAGRADPAGRQIVAALAADHCGLAIATARDAGPAVRSVPVARGAALPAERPTPDNLIGQRYPLARVLPVYLNRTPGRPIDPMVREFMRYLLSRQGQEDVAHDGGFLPLSPAAVRAEAGRLR